MFTTTNVARQMVRTAAALLSVAPVPWLAAGNSALQFDGNDIASVPHNALFDSIEQRDAVTIDAWIRIDSFPQGWFSIIDKYESSVDFGWTFQVSSVGSARTLQFVGGHGPTAAVPWAPTPGTWNHVAMSYERSAGRIDFFVNGGLLASRPYNADIQDTNGEPMYLGYNPSGGNEYCHGAIDELRLWKRALSASEIASVYNRGLNGDEYGLGAVWSFDEGAGGIFRDRGGHGIHGSLNSGSASPTWITSPVPEPSSLALLAAGSALALIRRRA